MSANNEKLIDKFEMAWNYGRTLCYANSIMPPQNATNEKDKKKSMNINLLFKRTILVWCSQSLNKMFSTFTIK